jgi:type I restriction enzyme S subunit
MSFPKYPAYKDSGVQWLGKVPEHWEVKHIKRLSPVQRGASPRPIENPKYFDDEGEYAWVRIADVSASDGVLRETPQRLSSLGSSLSVKLEPDQLFISIAGTVGKPCITGIKACIHDGFVYFPRLDIQSKFLYRIFEAGTCYAGLGKFGTQLNLNTDTIGSIQIAVPPAEEASKILQFLDRETAKIDALVAEQEKLVALLKEKRQSVISHAVTQGLDQSVTMKDSGIDWLGKVPAHWEVRKVKQLTSRISSGKTPLGGNETYLDEGVLFLRSQNVYDDGLRLDDAVFISEETHRAMAVSAVQPNDILLNITGASIGRSCLVPKEFSASNINQHVCVIRLVDEEAVPFVAWFFKSDVAKNQIDLAQNGAAREGLNFEQIGAMLLPLPNATEQFQIQSFLDAETAQLDALTTEAHSAIALLQERRTALISAAVTGQIDAR